MSSYLNILLEGKFRNEFVDSKFVDYLVNVYREYDGEEELDVVKFERVEPVHEDLPTCNAYWVHYLLSNGTHFRMLCEKVEDSKYLNLGVFKIYDDND